MMKKMASVTNQLSFKAYVRKLHQHARGKWLIHGTKHHKENQLQSLRLPCKIT